MRNTNYLYPTLINREVSKGEHIYTFIYGELKKAYGNHFQDLFSQIMKSKYGLSYMTTSTYGKAGEK